jgi:GxxExxY protein
MARHDLIEEALTHSVIGAFFDVYNCLGFGFLERVYIKAMDRELRARGHRVDREVAVKVMYKGEELGFQRLDMIVDAKLVVETKSTYELHRAATRQVYNYLRATQLDVGLLFHFGPEPKFYRLICRTPPIDASSTALRDASQRALDVGAVERAPAMDGVLEGSSGST